MNRSIARFRLPLFVVVALAASFSLQPAIALLAGVIFGIVFGEPSPATVKTFTRRLLQVSVVGLGFGMNLNQVLIAGSNGVIITAVTIGGTLALGYLLGNALKVGSRLSFLISSGTAICGGSAIAAVGPVIGATASEFSISLAIVFILNAIALLIFPSIGQLLNLSDYQFGLWSAIAIHDTSSVVGAASHYGDTALSVAVPMKLTRALWIVPVALLSSRLFAAERASPKWRNLVPTFIVFFLLACIANTFLLHDSTASQSLVSIAKRGLVLTLFLVGAGVSIENVKSVGTRPFLQGVLLWLVVCAASLWLVHVVA